MADPATVRIDLRGVIAVAALGIVVLVIIVVQLCGREEVEPQAQATQPPPQNTTPEPELPTPTPGPSPTPGPPTDTPTPQPGGAQRDVIRQQDLQDLQQALEEYHDEHGEYPNSDGNIQSLCVFEETDVGCQLRDVLDPLPIDPLGEPASENGYWYASDGDEYIIYAQREADEVPACPEHPDHLAQFDSLICVQGP